MTRLLSARLMRALMSYNPETGELVWKKRPVWMFNQTERRPRDQACRTWNTRYAGRVISTKMGGGYITVRIFGCRYLAHRIAWLLQMGKWPNGQLDHINGDPTDNRIANLRTVSTAENMQNQKLRFDNTSGHFGVYWIARSRKWGAQITSNSQYYSLGAFDTKEQAIAARKAAEKVLGFHPNHGRTQAEGAHRD